MLILYVTWLECTFLSSVFLYSAESADREDAICGRIFISCLTLHTANAHILVWLHRAYVWGLVYPVPVCVCVCFQGQMGLFSL